MTTSITDARYNVLHHTPSYTLALGFDEEPETGWSVMPGYEESLSIPPHLEPPSTDTDELLPSMVHPSYPYGRPVSLGASKKGKGKIGNLLDTLEGGRGLPARGAGVSSGVVDPWRGDRWDEWGLEDTVERDRGKEIPPGMAGAKRPPSPPSPALRPSHIPPARSSHLRRLLERQQQQSPPVMPTDRFDGPVPNELFDEDPQQQHQQQQQQQNAQNPVQGRTVIASAIGNGSREQEGLAGENGDMVDDEEDDDE